MRERTTCKILPVLVLLVVAATGALAGTGDADNNGTVTDADTLIALTTAAGILIPGPSQQAASDMAPDPLDGYVSIADATQIARIATGVDPPLPTGVMGFSTTLAVSGDTTRDIGLIGGYHVAGHLTDAAGAPFAGSIAFYNSTSQFLFGPWPVDASGAYRVTLPSGMYQPVAVTNVETQTALGERLVNAIAGPVGGQVAVASEVPGLDLQRPDLPGFPTVTFSVTGAPSFTPDEIVLTQTNAFKLNGADWTVASLPASTTVPAGVYMVEVDGPVPMTNGTEEAAVIYGQPLSVTGDASRALSLPTLYPLTGALSDAGAGLVQGVSAIQEAAVSADRFSASGGLLTTTRAYEMRLPSGTFDLAIDLGNSSYPNTRMAYVLSFAMTAAALAKDVAIPALPVFRTVTGQVYGRNGQGVAAATVTAVSALATVPSTGAFTAKAGTTTDRNGMYTLHLPDGSYSLSITPAG